MTSWPSRSPTPSSWRGSGRCCAALTRAACPASSRPGRCGSTSAVAQVTVESRPVRLTATEYRLACTLAAEPARVFTRDDLTDALWGCRNLRGRTLDTHAHRLRTKLANDTRSAVINVWGVGYRFLDPQ